MGKEMFDLYFDDKDEYDLNEYFGDVYEEQEIKDITEEFFQFFYDNRNNSRLGFIMRIIGSKGAGKTFLALILAYNIFITNPEKRRIAVWTMSESLVPTLKEIAPEGTKEKIIRIKTLREIENWDIVVVDEGVNIFNAKESLTVESRNTDKGLTIIRQKAVIFCVCGINDDLIRAIKRDAEIDIYKRCGRKYILSTEDKFIKDNIEIVRHLDQTQGYLISDHWLFDMEGGLTIDAKKYAPWLLKADEDVSCNMAKESMDIEGEEALRRQKEIKDIAILALKKYGKILLQSKNSSLIRSWLKNEHPEFIKYRKSTYITEILDEAIYLIREEELANKSKQIDPEDFQKYKTIVVPKINKDILTFSDYCKQYYTNNLTLSEKEKEYHIGILTMWALGLPQSIIREDLGGSPNTIADLIKKYRSGIKLENDELRLGYVLEFFSAEALKAKRGGGISQPDLMFYNNTGKVFGPGEAKLVQTKSNSITFKKYSKNPNNHSLNPSYLYCKEHNIPRFPLIYFWPKWRNEKEPPYPMLIPISIKGDNEIFIEKMNYNEYVNNFFNFNKNQFFKSTKNK